jgi:hypothetical protein
VNCTWASELVLVFEVEDGEDRQFRTASFISIGLLKPGGAL